jgi:hypothetical protein
MVGATAIAPVLMGWLIDAGVSIGAMALGGTAYTLIASSLAWLARARCGR